ncbi:vacuole morphology and inheritance protein [Aulographum hederae CBS 113979]|uniref:Vacuole morphology and inheritance protein n=1 Tax=Aulographum hederae CBS 113979 TaxID=1176131 RepID=A0A6G1GTY8_9PEZI|nr:vacuole morphology and inheritance protein [Aulographum hederae CBS 113979]
MDANIQKALNDKLYDKRKSGALELEALIRESLAANDHDRIAKIVHELCHDYAYAVHQPHARNGGLIGLAAASIALGSEVARHLEEIVPPVLACFSDQDARVRYYACESMYNIAKVAKGEILIYFNDVFDALCKLAADNELSVKNGAELLDRLIKDIVSESSASYVSVLHTSEQPDSDSTKDDVVSIEPPTAFSLARFVPLLQERINVINPFTRTFLVSWITLLDSIPDLELVSYLPSFLGGLFKFLSDPNQDVHNTTQVALDRFLAEIKKISRIKKGIAESRRSHGDDAPRRSDSSMKSEKSSRSARSVASRDSLQPDAEARKDGQAESIAESESDTANEDSSSGDGDWVPGQDVQVDHPKILDILVTFLSESSDQEIQLTVLRWIDTLFEICPEDILLFVPRLLSQVLPAMSSDVEQVCQAANRVNTSLMEYIVSLSNDSQKAIEPPPTLLAVPSTVASAVKEGSLQERRESTVSSRGSRPPNRELAPESRTATVTDALASTTPDESPPAPRPSTDLDYEAAVNALTLQFLNEHEATRVAALAWLIMLHRKAPRKLLAINDGTFPALLKTLSDPSEAVVTRDLLLLSQISRNSDDSYFTSFMVNLLKLFCTDRRLLETRGNLIIRQLCVSLSAERIYRTLADCLEKDEDVEFASIMVQNLNNNLITAPELADLRKRLRNMETRDGQTFFVTLFKSWCHNAVATFSLCLLAQAYEQAYNLLQIFGDLEMTVNMLIQIDKLVQLLESPVFTYLRLQLLEPERYPHLYKCLYGLLMLLPQSSAFAALKNRLNSVSAIGYLHTVPRTNPATPASSGFERSNRLKAREDGGIRWVELLEKFKAVQEKARRSQRGVSLDDDDASAVVPKENRAVADVAGNERNTRPNSAQGTNRPPPQPASSGTKAKSSLSNLGRFAGGVGGRKSKK